MKTTRRCFLLRKLVSHTDEPEHRHTVVVGVENLGGRKRRVIHVALNGQSGKHLTLPSITRILKYCHLRTGCIPKLPMKMVVGEGVPSFHYQTLPPTAAFHLLSDDRDDMLAECMRLACCLCKTKSEPALSRCLSLANNRLGILSLGVLPGFMCRRRDGLGGKA